MNVKNLNDNPESLNSCLKLIENSFNYPAGYSFKDDFSLLLNKSNFKNCFFLESDEQPVATLFTLPRVLKYKSIELPVLFLGGISVKDENRGAGLFRTLLETILMLNQDCAFFFLWSDLSQLYEKFNFFEFGLIEEIDHANQKPIELSKITEEDYAKVEELYEKVYESNFIPKRTKEDWSLLKSSNVINKGKDSNNNFYFFDKGLDLQGICHERHPSDAPLLRGKVNWNLVKDNPDGEKVLRYMGFIRLGNVELISDFISKVTMGRIKIIEMSGSKMTISFDDEIFEMNSKDFIQGIWGPGKVQEWIGLVPDIMVYGFDSI